MKKSVYWLGAAPPSALPSLQENTEADAVVVGGGIAGPSAAQWLREPARPGRAFTPVEPLTSVLPKGSAFRVSHLYTRTLLEGRSDSVARQQRRVKRMAIALAGAAAMAGGLLWMGRRRR